MRAFTARLLAEHAEHEMRPNQVGAEHFGGLTRQHELVTGVIILLQRQTVLVGCCATRLGTCPLVGISKSP